MAQLYISSLCESEVLQEPDDKVHFSHDLFLRTDIPCHDKCLVDESFRKQDVFFHPCWACRDGT